ncbi:GNAT family N-acetyltransferase [Legionella sp.]|uniref:GNAT family N-acetyltransferase n=1 Tax=Legionella sp. TaxID=459 RepID=UPI003CC0D737
MPKYHQSLTEKQQKSSIDRPLSCGLAPYALTGDQLMMIPLMPDHRYKLYTEIFSQPQVMQYFGTGKSFTFDEYTSMHIDRAKQNLTLQYDQYTGRLSRFTWTIITHDGIAGRLNIFPTEGRTELAFCISPTQQGRALARRASELVIEYMGEESSFIATAHPLNKASSKTLEQIHYPDGKFVFFRDPQRQNVPNKYGTNQPRDYFLSQRENKFSFFSFNRGLVCIDSSKELQQKNTIKCV